MNIVYDMGGVLMEHNTNGCIRRLVDLMGMSRMETVLGLYANGEGAENSLMDRFECGLVSEREFIDTLLSNSRPGTTPNNIVDAWNTMHGGIPVERLKVARRQAEMGHHLFLLSNSNSIHYRDICEHYDISFFEHCFMSHELHCRKPDRAIYNEVNKYLAEHHLSSHPVIFVDDIQANRVVGAAVGWTVVDEMDKINEYL